MALHFSPSELAERRRRACAKLEAQGLHGLVMFRQESMYYLTGYDTSGYTMFQGLYLGADGRLALLTRTADQRQAAITSVIKDIRIWRDHAEANPGRDLRDLLESLGCTGRLIGIEYHAYGFTAQRGRMVDTALDGFCETFDASDLVRELRLVKSQTELDYLRKAGTLADAAFDTAREMTRPGARIGAIYGEMTNTIMRGGGDPSASRWPMGAGEEALLVRYHTSQGTVADNDQVQFEFAAAYRHYHAALMNVILTGRVDPRHRDMFKACVEALEACREALRPGNSVGELYEAHARSFAAAGYQGHELAACGYTMGATYPPTWMDWPMIYRGNPDVLEPNMVFFLHMILLNSETGLTMSLGETAIVTESGCESICHAPRELIIN